MPELPEVETVVRALRQRIVGRRMLAVNASVNRLRTRIDISALRAHCCGQTIRNVTRRAKYIRILFESGGGLLLHLGMTGAFRVETTDTARSAYDRVWWNLDDGSSWRFEDIRRFGSVQTVSADEWEGMLAHLGPEPLGPNFSGEVLFHLSRGRRVSVKTLIMDQRRVVGLGNIYANEALFRARIRPTRMASRLSKAVCARLHMCIVEVLSEAIEQGGTTISDFKGLDGSEGRFHLMLDVYGRGGEECRCGTLVKRIVHGGRATFYCPHCQV